MHLRDASPMARKGHGARLRRTWPNGAKAGWRLSYTTSDDCYVVHDIPVPQTVRSIVVVGPNFTATRHVQDTWTTVIRRTGRVSVGCTEVPPGALRRLTDASDRMVRTARERRVTLLSVVTRPRIQSEWDVTEDGSVVSQSSSTVQCGTVTRETVLRVKKLLS